MKMFNKIIANNLSLFLIFKFFIIILICIYLIFSNIKYKIKVCICTIGKLENLYIREFLEYYNKLGVDKIFIYDNNEINGEHFETVIYDYIIKNYVSIINFRGYLKPQFKMMKSCYKKNYLKYDWIIFIDIDEFLYLKNYSSIKKYLKEVKFNKCKIIYLNFIFYSDNNFLYYKNKSVISRFKERSFNNKRYWGKSIVRGNIAGFKITSPHRLTNKIKLCNGFGKISKSFKIDSKYYDIKHYSFKSTEEYCYKLNRGNILYDNNYQFKFRKINKYFQYNRITLNKINLLENKTGINLEYFRNKIITYKKRK
jgi:hypothetical protein